MIAIEPDAANLALLRHNVHRTVGARVEVVEGAAWSTEARLPLTRCVENTGDHRIAALADERETVGVCGRPLDDIVGDRDVDVLLLDTQATEHVALRGARRMLERCRPVCLVEFWPDGIRTFGDDPVAVVDEYRELCRRITVLELPELPDDASAEDLVSVADETRERFVTLVLEPADG